MADDSRLMELGSISEDRMNVLDERNKMSELMDRLRSRRQRRGSWSDTLKYYKSSITDKRFVNDSLDKSLIHRHLEALQKVVRVSDTSSLTDRLDHIATKHGLKFSLVGADVYLRGDAFYLQIQLNSPQGVKDALVCFNSEPTSCPELVKSLSEGHLDEVEAHLRALAHLAALSPDKKLRSKLITALVSLETDLNKLSKFQSIISSVPNYIHKSPLGILLPRTGGLATKMVYFVGPYDLLREKTRTSTPMTVEAIVENRIGHSVTVELESSTPRKLQTMPLMTVNQTDGKSQPYFSPMANFNSTVMPAVFVLRLEKPLPISLTVLRKIKENTGLDVVDSCHIQSMTSLLLQQCRGHSHRSPTHDGLHVRLPDQHHRYYLAGHNGDEQGALVSTLPFCHPTRVPFILKLLRQQVLFNTVLSSCIRPHSPSHDNTHCITFEVTPVSMQTITVSFEHPCRDAIATVELDLSDITSVKCRLSSEGSEDSSFCPEDLATRVLQRSLSLPITMRAILQKARDVLRVEVERCQPVICHLPCVTPQIDQQPAFIANKLPTQHREGNKSRASPMGAFEELDGVLNPASKAASLLEGDKVNRNPMLAMLLDQEQANNEAASSEQAPRTSLATPTTVGHPPVYSGTHTSGGYAAPSSVSHAPMQPGMASYAPLPCSVPPSMLSHPSMMCAPPNTLSHTHMHPNTHTMPSHGHILPTVSSHATMHPNMHGHPSMLPNMSCHGSMPQNMPGHAHISPNMSSHGPMPPNMAVHSHMTANMAGPIPGHAQMVPNMAGHAPMLPGPASMHPGPPTTSAHAPMLSALLGNDASSSQSNMSPPPVATASPVPRRGRKRHSTSDRSPVGSKRKVSEDEMLCADLEPGSVSPFDFTAVCTNASANTTPTLTTPTVNMDSNPFMTESHVSRLATTMDSIIKQESKGSCQSEVRTNVVVTEDHHRDSFNPDLVKSEHGGVSNCSSANLRRQSSGSGGHVVTDNYHNSVQGEGVTDCGDVFCKDVMTSSASSKPLSNNKLAQLKSQTQDTFNLTATLIRHNSDGGQTNDLHDIDLELNSKKSGKVNLNDVGSTPNMKVNNVNKTEGDVWVKVEDGCSKGGLPPVTKKKERREVKSESGVNSPTVLTESKTPITVKINKNRILKQSQVDKHDDSPDLDLSWREKPPSRPPSRPPSLSNSIDLELDGELNKGGPGSSSSSSKTSSSPRILTGSLKRADAKPDGKIKGEKRKRSSKHGPGLDERKRRRQEEAVKKEQLKKQRIYDFDADVNETENFKVEKGTSVKPNTIKITKISSGSSRSLISGVNKSPSRPGSADNPVNPPTGVPVKILKSVDKPVSAPRLGRPPGSKNYNRSRSDPHNSNSSGKVDSKLRGVSVKLKPLNLAAGGTTVVVSVPSATKLSPVTPSSTRPQSVSSSQTPTSSSTSPRVISTSNSTPNNTKASSIPPKSRKGSLSAVIDKLTKQQSTPSYGSRSADVKEGPKKSDKEIYDAIRLQIIRAGNEPSTPTNESGNKTNSGKKLPPTTSIANLKAIPKVPKTVHSSSPNTAAKQTISPAVPGRKSPVVSTGNNAPPNRSPATTNSTKPNSSNKPPVKPIQSPVKPPPSAEHHTAAERPKDLDVSQSSVSNCVIQSPPSQTASPVTVVPTIPLTKQPPNRTTHFPVIKPPQPVTFTESPASPTPENRGPSSLKDTTIVQQHSKDEALTPDVTSSRHFLDAVIKLNGSKGDEGVEAGGDGDSINSVSSQVYESEVKSTGVPPHTSDDESSAVGTHNHVASKPSNGAHEQSAESPPVWDDKENKEDVPSPRIPTDVPVSRTEKCRPVGSPHSDVSSDDGLVIDELAPSSDTRSPAAPPSRERTPAYLSPRSQPHPKSPLDTQSPANHISHSPSPRKPTPSPLTAKSRCGAVESPAMNQSLSPVVLDDDLMDAALGIV